MIDLPLDAITLDADLQPRVKISRRVNEDLACEIAAGTVLPPVLVVFDGTKHWLVDGYHRWYTYRALGLTTIAADVRQGDVLAALRLSLGANAEHGRRRTPADYQRAFKTALRYRLVGARDIQGVATL